ncbi:WW domain-binding protein 2 [Fasciolopsis buskii]|uniref:WW domain-binding protein 2 n=1 Tax=Fasciolopsis buskii TaxID=27845 RepID=A0A8E0RNG5_9TREM|nr:WW domain-binding protein 2 [Fasciolopsis buski]
MSLNTSHRVGVDGVLLFYGERLLIFYDGCELKLGPPLKGTHTGRVYLTSHRVIFINKNSSSGLLSMSMPFVYMKQIDVKQPVFGANSIVGHISAESNGGWQGEAEFKFTFKKGGAIEFAQALIDLGRRACSAKQTFRPPPPYTSTMDINGAGQFYSCPPPAYAPPYNDPYYGFIKPHDAFSQPPPSSLYYVGAPPPYPGAAPQENNVFPSAPPYPEASGYPPPPNQFGGHGAVGGNVNSSSEPMSAAHAGKLCCCYFRSALLSTA